MSPTTLVVLDGHGIPVGDTLSIEPEKLNYNNGFSAVAVLVWLSGPNRGWTPVVTGPKGVIGAAADADLVVHDRTISGHHAAVAWHDDEWYIADSDSRNGTLVGGSRTSRARWSAAIGSWWGASGFASLPRT